MKTLEKKFKHNSWFVRSGKTIKEVLDIFAEERDFYLTKRMSIKQSDRLLDEIRYDYVIQHSGSNKMFYRLSEEEKKYYIERHLLVEKWEHARNMFMHYALWFKYDDGDWRRTVSSEERIYCNDMIYYYNNEILKRRENLIKFLKSENDK